MVDETQKRIIAEAHSFENSIHLGSTKMYRDLRAVYWWNIIKNKYLNLFESGETPDLGTKSFFVFI